MILRVGILVAPVLAAVLAATLILYSGGENSGVTETDALELPADLSLIFTEVDRSYNTIDGSYIVVHEDIIDSRRQCEFCSVVQFYDGPSDGSTQVTWSAGRPFSMEGAGKITFYAMGDTGGEIVRFKAAGTRVSLNTLDDTAVTRVLPGIAIDFAVETKPVTLTDRWQKYEIDLGDKNLVEVTDALAIEAGEGQSSTVWIKGLVLEEGPAQGGLVEDQTDG